LLGFAQMISTIVLDATPGSLLSETRCLPPCWVRTRRYHTSRVIRSPSECRDHYNPPSEPAVPDGSALAY
jgi:hypothetical protein